MRPRILALFLAAAALAGCGDWPMYSHPLADRYILTSVDGRPVPAAIDTSHSRYTGPVVYRIVGRSIEFTSGEAARYQYASDYAEAAASGDSPSGIGSCTSLPVQYRRFGTRLVLIVDVNQFPQRDPVPLRLDTLFVDGGNLVQDVRFSGRTLRLEYSPVRSVPSLCEGR